VLRAEQHFQLHSRNIGQQINGGAPLTVLAGGVCDQAGCANPLSGAKFSFSRTSMPSNTRGVAVGSEAMLPAPSMVSAPFAPAPPEEGAAGAALVLAGGAGVVARAGSPGAVLQSKSVTALAAIVPIWR